MADLSTTSMAVFTQLADVVWEKEKASLPMEALNSGIFKVEDIAQGTGDTRQFTEIDSEEYAKAKNESDQASHGKVQQGYTLTVTPIRFARDITISYEMRSRNKYSDVISRLTNGSRQVFNRLELDLQHRITFGTATTYANMDGQTINIAVGDTLALFSTAHTLRGSATTFRNRLANNPQFSKGALEGMEQLTVTQTLNQFGEKVSGMPFDIIVTTDDPNLVNSVKEYLVSTAAPDSNNSGVTNVYRGKYRHVVFTKIATTAAGAVDSTKYKYWGIVSSKYSTAHCAIWERPRLLPPPAPANGREDSQSEDWIYGSRGSWGIGIVTGNFIFFSSGDGVA